MRILAIETSCDETAISIVQFENQEVKVLSHAVLSQIEMHKEWGGVVPGLAKREHQKNLFPILVETMKEAGLYEKGATRVDESKIEEWLWREEDLTKNILEQLPNIAIPDIDRIAVTSGPGLEPALWVGINFAKVLAHTWNKPLYPTNHMEGHIYSSLLEKTDSGYKIADVNFPAVALLISGGHTELIEMKGWNSYKLLGKTRDDAVGEAFDKVARILGLPYPGGPEISKLSSQIEDQEEFNLPRPMINSGDLDFSFSGLKTAVLYQEKQLENLSQEQKINLAHEFEIAVTEVLEKKTLKAIEETGSKSLIIGGGVIANKRIREMFKERSNSEGFELFIPDMKMTTDNATMIAIAAYHGHEDEISNVVADGNLKLSN